MFDYHVHTHYSADCTAPLSIQLDAAAAAGLLEVCLTDHIDFDRVKNGKPFFEPADLGARSREIETLRPLYPSLTIRRGVEIALAVEESCARLSYDYIKDEELDFALGSLHVIEGTDVYRNEFFEGKTQLGAYLAYLETLERSIRTCDLFCAMGHYDFIAKNAPFPERALSLSLAPEVFDGIFTYLIQSGKTLELNTSAWRNDPAWGLDVFKRFRELGGEFVTVGSDAHKPTRVGMRFNEAHELLRAAGIRYIATYEKMKPIMHNF